MKKNKSKYGISVETFDSNTWSFGMAITHCEKRTVLFINLFKLSIGLGEVNQSKRGAK